MDFRKVRLVMGREYSIRVKKKSFILTTIITPILFAALMIVPTLVMMMDTNSEQRKVMVVDASSIVYPTLTDKETVQYVPGGGGDPEYLKTRLDSLGVFALLYISPLDSANNVSATVYSVKQLNADLSDIISSDIDQAMEEYKLGLYDIKDFDKILEDVQTSVPMQTFTIGKDGSVKETVLGINMALSFVMGFIIYMFVVMFGQMVMTSVINEKSNRIVEVIISSVKPFELMIGKIVGVACVALTQFFVWVVLTIVLVFGFQAVAGPELFGDPQAAGQMMDMAGMGSAGVGEIVSDQGQIHSVLSALTEIDFLYVIGCFIVYFILGYLLYASLFAAIGSAVDNEADTQQLMIPVTIPLLIGMFIMLSAFNNPDSQLAFWGSVIPFTSPMVMMARIPFEGGVPLWELLLSIGLLLVTFLITVYVSGKIYRVGILMYGKKYSWKDIYKWMKY